MTKRILILALLVTVVLVWWRVLDVEKPRKLNEAERRESVAPGRKGRG